MTRVLIYITLLIVTGCTEKVSEKTIHQHEMIPTFDILLNDNVFFNTKSILAGKPSVFFYFSPRCPYSKAQISEIVENISELKEIQFYIFTTRSFGDMHQISSKYKLANYKNVTVGIDTSNFFAHYFGAKGFPTLAIYNKEKKLNGLFLGQMTKKQIKNIANKN